MITTDVGKIKGITFLFNYKVLINQINVIQIIKENKYRNILLSLEISQEFVNKSIIV